MNGKQGEKQSWLFGEKQVKRMGKVDIAVLNFCQRAELLSALPAVMSHWRVFLDSAEEDGVLHRFVCFPTYSAILSENNTCLVHICPVASKYNHAACKFVKQPHLSAVYLPLFVLAERNCPQRSRLSHAANVLANLA